MLELAMHWNEEGVFQKDIAKRQDISFKYLDQIISALKSAGLIVNADGRKSGYILAREPEKIEMYDIYKAFEPELLVIDCLTEDGQCKRDKHCATKDFWFGLNEHIITYLKSTTLSQLADKQKEINLKFDNNMYYI